MDTLSELKAKLQLAKSPEPPKAIFFKIAPGEYAAHDQFIHVSVPNLRKIAKQYPMLPLPLIQQLIESSINEERLLALFILINRYQKDNDQIKNAIFEFYLQNLQHINNWNLVDASAHWIIGAHLFAQDKSPLLLMAESTNLWERRIAIVSTWYFIRQHDFEYTLKLALKLLHDSHDLIHKAVGWMLRELGKRDEALLVEFLTQHAHEMPKTMLRYSIEKFPLDERKRYLSSSTSKSFIPGEVS